MISTDNPYLKQIYQTLPRVLSLYDTDTSSPTYGVGDRFCWAWKLIDFANGTFQGVVAGLALLIKHNLYPINLNKNRCLDRINSIIAGLKRITANNGSLAEALPNESSFCVTGLVAADILLAAELLKPQIDKQIYDEWLESACPLIHFLYKQDEYHGIISNHLATCALALVRWADVCPTEYDKANTRAKLFIDRILSNQSKEGWFKEYDGADAGYQSWCLSSLIEIDELRPEWLLEQPIKEAIHFLTYAVHPDGSFGGSYGSRMTRFVFPYAFEKYAEKDAISSRLSSFFRGSIEQHRCVTLNAIDNGNLVPLFNNYVQAAVLFEQQSKPNPFSKEAKLPFEDKQATYYFPDAGWYIAANSKHYTIINVKKSGAGLRTYHDAIKAVVINPPLIRTKNSAILSGGFIDPSIELHESEQQISFDCHLKKLSRPQQSALKFLILRTLSVSAFRSLILGNYIKILLAKYLVNKQPKTVLSIKRTIELGDNLKITDSLPENTESINVENFKPIHMASQGYWQVGDDL